MRGFQRFVNRERRRPARPSTGPVSVCIDGSTYIVSPRTFGQVERFAEVTEQLQTALSENQHRAIFQAIRELFSVAFSPDVPLERFEAIPMSELTRVWREELPKVFTGERA